MTPFFTLMAPGRGHGSASSEGFEHRNRIVPLVGDAEGALPIAQDFRVSRLVTDTAGVFEYRSRSAAHGVYVLVLEGELTLGRTVLSRRESAAFPGEEPLVCAASGASEVMFVETVMSPTGATPAEG